MSGVSQGGQDTEPADGPQTRTRSGDLTVSSKVNKGISIGWAERVLIKVREHRSRILFVVVPVVTTGGAFLAGTLVPHESAAPEHGSQGRGKPSPSVLSSPSPAGSSSASPSASAVSPPPPVPMATRAPAGPDPHDDSGGGPAPGRSPDPAPTAQGGAPGPRAAGTGTLSPGARSHLENVAQQQCLSGDDFSPAFGPCGAGSSYSWTLRSTGGGAFTLVNRASGKCLTAPNNNNYAAGLNPCGWGANEHWHIDTSASAGQTLQNNETGHCLTIAPPQIGFNGANQVQVATCNSDDPRQLWKGGGPA
ncbi:hypothetical protein GCM10010218_27070 [Streptomyces mashuensis]|uniref:Ricin B lectin domain-containing protein n=1 Tax=Streptomyces mashuensis TaxID=33904 RepID=A0A919ED23_9ACTN|nr:RICIN domain-containing protein [Streptomyces mashuensis]GHF44332.1 hypothetical protein GCM10010218_27070 [Streptomyces mashuensis]